MEIKINYYTKYITKNYELLILEIMCKRNKNWINIKITIIVNIIFKSSWIKNK